MTFVCPKCRGEMRTYDRQGVHIEQCVTCRGVFLDYGELEHLSQLEARMMQPPPPPAGYPAPAYGHGTPAWGAPYHGHHRKGFSRMLFST
jgi:uncharacterized protein